MKNFILASVVSMSLMSVSCYGNSNESIKSSNDKTKGEKIEKEFNLSNFSKLDISSAFDVVVHKSDKYSVKITISTELEEDLVVTLFGDELDISLNNSLNKRHPMDAILKAEISMPNLEGLDLSGATTFTCDDTFKVNEFDCELSGASKISKLTVEANEADFDISGASKAYIYGGFNNVSIECSGASKLNIEGKTKLLSADCSGASSIDAYELIANEAEIEASGTSNVEISVIDVIREIDASGLSGVKYKSSDNCRIIEQEVSGMSKLTKTGTLK